MIVNALETMARSMIDAGVAHCNRFTVNLGEVAFNALLSEADKMWDPFLFERDPKIKAPDSLELQLSGKNLKCYRRGLGRSIEITPFL